MAIHRLAETIAAMNSVGVSSRSTGLMETRGAQDLMLAVGGASINVGGQSQEHSYAAQLAGQQRGGGLER